MQAKKSVVSLSSLLTLFGFFLASCGGGSDAGAGNLAADCIATVPSPYALWSEFLDSGEVLEQVPVLRSHSVSLYQNVRSERIGDPATEAFLRRAACSGLEVRAWLTLPEGDGYWPNERNAGLFAEKALELARWIRSSDLPVEWIVVDMELDLRSAERLQELLAEGDLAGAVRLFADNYDPDLFQAARDEFATLVDELHLMGFRVMLVTFPMVLDDREDGDSDIQDLMNIPVDGIP
ncbi:MAG: hypothetical protein AB1640_23980 [bacterium]